MGASSAQFVTGPQSSRRDLSSDNTVDIGAVLLMQVGEAPCCVAITQITELIRVPALVRVPLAPPAVLGLFNHRSNVATAFSLRWYLGLEDGVPGEGVLVMSRVDNELMGYQVDEISDIIHPSAGNWREVPPHLLLAFCDRILVQPGHLYALIDLDRLRAVGLSRDALPGEQESQTLAYVLQAVRAGSLADLEVSPRRAAHDPTVSALPTAPDREGVREAEPDAIAAGDSTATLTDAVPEPKAAEVAPVIEPLPESGMDAPAEQFPPVEAPEAVSEKHEPVSQLPEQMAGEFAPAPAGDEAEAAAEAAAETESEVSVERETEEERQAIEENEAKEPVQESPPPADGNSKPVLPAMHNLADWEISLLESAVLSGTETAEPAETFQEDEPLSQPKDPSAAEVDPQPEPAVPPAENSSAAEPSEELAAELPAAPEPSSIAHPEPAHGGQGAIESSAESLDAVTKPQAAAEPGESPETEDLPAENSPVVESPVELAANISAEDATESSSTVSPETAVDEQIKTESSSAEPWLESEAEIVGEPAELEEETDEFVLEAQPQGSSAAAEPATEPTPAETSELKSGQKEEEEAVSETESLEAAEAPDFLEDEQTAAVVSEQEEGCQQSLGPEENVDKVAAEEETAEEETTAAETANEEADVTPALLTAGKEYPAPAADRAESAPADVLPVDREDREAGKREPSFELVEGTGTTADKAPAREPSPHRRHRISGRHVAAAALLLFLGVMAWRFILGWGQPEKLPAAQQVSPPAIINQVEEIEPPPPAPVPEGPLLAPATQQVSPPAIINQAEEIEPPPPAPVLEGPPPAPPVPTEEVSSGAGVITPDLSDYIIHTVVAGDTLSKLAARYLGDWRRYPELVDENGIKNPDLIYVDDILRIPPADD